MAARVTTLLLMTVLFGAAWSTDQPPQAARLARMNARSRSQKSIASQSTTRCLAAPVNVPPGGYDAVDMQGRKLRITVTIVDESPEKTSSDSVLR